jgi:hypothetical protein
LHRDTFAGNVTAVMNAAFSAVDCLTSAYMAAGMTSRARRPSTDSPLG